MASARTTLSALQLRRRNWSGSVPLDAAQFLTPRTEDDVLRILATAREHGRTVRVVGGGHSFSPVADGSDVLISMDHMQGLVRADRETGLVTLRGGTRLSAVKNVLGPEGLGLEVMGDIDLQSIAGAIQTGTHGTGAQFTGFAGMVRGLRLALADGSVVEVSAQQEPELFQAGRLGLGMIGVVLEVTLQCVPRYSMSLEESAEGIDQTADSFLDECSRLDHCEFFWFPRTQRATVRRSTRVPSSTPRVREHPAAEWLNKELLGNRVWEQLCRATYLVPPLTQPVAELASRLFDGAPMTDDAPAVYAASRGVRFHEAEFAIPAEHFEEAFARLRRRFEEENVRVCFPLEIRRVKADEVWMSTAHQRESVYIAAHTYHWFDPVPYLLMVQRTLEPFGARPHWGKMHWMRGAELRELYPRMGDFLAVRAEADPDGLFLTPYLRSLFGI